MSIVSLDSMYQARSAANRRGKVDRLGHLLHIRAILHAGIRKRIDAVRALYGNGDRQPDQSFFALRDRAVLLSGLVPSHELLEQFGSILPYIAETGQIFFVVIVRPIHIHISLFLNYEEANTWSRQKQLPAA